MTDAPDTTADTSSTPSERPNSKVARLIKAYSLDGFGDKLEALWTAEGDERRSLRDLADRFNRRLLRTKLNKQTSTPLEGEIKSIYQALTDNDVSAADASRVRRRLKRQDIDVGALEDDFVTYQAIRTYLQEYRGAEYSGGREDPIEGVKQDLQRLQGRTETVTKSKLEQLQAADELVTGCLNVIVETGVICEDCGTQYTVDELLEQRECECSRK